MLYLGSFGIVTKSPKSETSRRTITIPDKLLEILLEYKKWWNEMRVNMGDRWDNRNQLFLQDDGKNMHPYANPL